MVSPSDISPDGTLIAAFTIPGRPYSKKTSQRIIGRRILPSQNFIDYQERCGPCLETAWAGRKPLDFGLRIVMRVWMPNWASMPDHCGLMQSLGDVLEHHNIIANDAWLVWDTSGSHWLSGIDKDNPRVEITLFRLRHPKENRSCPSSP